jgi:hypothetical protein
VKAALQNVQVTPPTPLILKNRLLIYISKLEKWPHQGKGYSSKEEEARKLTSQNACFVSYPVM